MQLLHRNMETHRWQIEDQRWEIEDVRRLIDEKSQQLGLVGFRVEFAVELSIVVAAPDTPTALCIFLINVFKYL
jgi:hypothetical protein